MKKSLTTYLTITALLLFSINAKSQTLAVTEYGDTIYVYDNGTWSFEILEEVPEDNKLSFLDIELTIDTIDKEFVYPATAKKQVNNAQGQFSIKYDGKIWKRVPPATLNEEAEFAFKSKKDNLWSVIIFEETTIEASSLIRIAKYNMEKKTGTTAEILKTELLTVNGTEVIRGVLKANLSGITFIFDSYYFSNDKGSVQYTTWTSAKIWEKNQETIADLLNGFIAK